MTTRETSLNEHEPQQNAKVPVRRWLLAFDCYNFSSSVLLTNAIWVIYLIAHGYSPFAIGLFEMVFHIAKFIFEVPTGIFADLLGRRKSLVVYCLLGAIQQLLFLYPTLALITLSFALSGVAWAFRGGANEAVLWGIAGYADPGNQSRRYSRLVSRMYMIGLLGEILGVSVGGMLGNILQVLPFIAEAAFSVIAIIPLLLLPERRFGLEHRTNPFRHLWTGLSAVGKSPVLLGLLLIDALAESCWQTIYFYNQLYLHGLGFSLVMVGVIVAVSTGTNFLFTASAPLVMRHVSERWIIPLCMLMEVLGLFLMSLPVANVSLLGYLVFLQASVAILGPAISTFVNERSPERQRATVLSFQTGLFSAAMIVLFPLFGLGVTHVSYSTVYLWTLIALAGGCAIIFGIVQLLRKFS